MCRAKSRNGIDARHKVADQVSGQHQLLLPHHQASSRKTLSAGQTANRHCEGMRQPRMTQTEMVWTN